MKIHDVIGALAGVHESAIPRRPKAAEKSGEAAGAAVEGLRDWLDRLTGLLDEYESYAEELKTADPEDREDYHANLTAAAAELRDELVDATAVATP